MSAAATRSRCPTSCTTRRRPRTAPTGARRGRMARLPEARGGGALDDPGRSRAVCDRGQRAAAARRGGSRAGAHGLDAHAARPVDVAARRARPPRPRSLPRRPGAVWFGHSGGNEGFRCHLLAHRDAGCGLAVMTNGDRGHALIGELLNDVAQAMEWPGYVVAEPDGDAEPSVALDALAGVYELRPGAVIEVTPRGDDLLVAALGQPAIRFLRAVGRPSSGRSPSRRLSRSSSSTGARRRSSSVRTTSCAAAASAETALRRYT